MANIKAIAIGGILSIIAIIVVLQLVSSAAPALQGAGNNLTDTYNGTRTNLPLTGLFSSTGIVMLIIVVGVLVTTIGLALKRGG